MNPLANISSRSWLRFFRAGTAVSAAMLVVTAVSMAGGFDRPALAAPIPRGAVTFTDPDVGTITGGGSGPFLITLPAGAACQGSGASGYRWETFFVSASVDVGALTYTSGPVAVSGAFVSALFDTFGDQISTKFPSTSPLGLISGIPLLSLQTQTVLPLGSYKIGIACTFNNATEDYWSSVIDVTANTSDAPLGIAWTAAAGSTTSTTTTTTAGSTTTAGATTTTRPATTTTTSGATTTTTPGSTTTAAAASVTSSTVRFTSSAASQSTGGSSSAGAIPVAGSSPVPLVVWAILFLVFGRMTILVARPLKVLPPTSR